MVNDLRENFESHIGKPLLRGVSHVVAFVVSLFSGVLLALQATAVASLVAALVYAAGLSLALGTSALYHRVRWSPRGRRMAQKLDHSMIFVLVASTYTPILVLGTHGGWRLWGLIAVWVMASGGVIMRLAIPDLPRAALVAAYLGTGWAAVALLPRLHQSLSPEAFALLVTGGLLYAVGAFIYLFKRPNPFPRVFGFHEVFHVFVIAAATCHYLAVFDTLTRQMHN
jgi:hemolysin III